MYAIAENDRNPQWPVRPACRGHARRSRTLHACRAAAARWRLAAVRLPSLLVMAACCLARLGFAAEQSCGPTPAGPPASCSASSVASTGGNGGADAGAGNPINIITGNKYQREEDLPALPGILGLEIVRHYNSAYSTPASPNGAIGRGWRLSYETTLFDQNGKIQVLQADGGRAIFHRDPALPGLCSTSLPANGRMQLVRQANGSTEYDWIWPNGRRLHFNSRGKLERIAAPTGEAVDLLYDSEDVLVRVTDPQGRSLNLIYLDRARARAADRFRGVQHIDSPVGRFSYEYGSAAPKDSVPVNPQLLLANLVRVRPPGNDGPGIDTRSLANGSIATSTVSRIYHHEDARFPWLMTGFSLDATGTSGKPVVTRIATFGYDGNGKANLSTHANNAGKVTLERRGAGMTMLTNSLGQQTSYRHAMIDGEHRMLEVRGPGCALCGENNVRYGYDRQGKLTETTKLGPDYQPVQTLRAQLDHLGRPLLVSRIRHRQGRALAPEWLLRYEYGGNTQQPTLVARPSAVPGKEARLETEYNSRGQPLRTTERGWSPVLPGQDAPLPIERTTTYQYRESGGRSLLAQVDGPLPNGRHASPADSDITRYDYDAHGNVLRMTAPGGMVAEVTRRDSALRAVQVRTVDGTRTIESHVAYGYDGRMLGTTRRAWQTGEEGMLERTMAFRYDAAARLAAIVGPDNVTLRAEYDDAGRLRAYLDGKGNRISQQFDSEGRLIARVEQDAQGRTLGGLLNLWDEQNRLRARLNPTGVIDAVGATARAGESVELDGNGDTAAATRRENGIDILAADDSTRRLWLLPHALLMQDGAKRLHAIVKDDFGRTVAERSPDEGLLTFTYAGTVIDKRHIGKNTGKNNGHSVTERLEFLQDGRLHRRIRPDCTEAFRYEGRLLAGVEGCGHRHGYRRDALGQITEHTQTVDRPGTAPLAFRTAYAYHRATGQLAERVLPDGQHLRYRYDAVDGSAVGVTRDRGWLAWTGRSVSTGLACWLRSTLPQALASEAVIAQVAWRPFGGMAAVTAANGLTTAGTFDTSGRMTALAVTGGGAQAVENLAYRYDGAGNLVRRIRNGSTRHYRYDAMRRLRADSADPGMPAGLRYDALGMRTAAGPSPGHDEFGRMDERNGQRFRYNGAHQLVSVTRNGKEIAHYRYDALGNRVAKTAGAETIYFLYDTAHQLVAEADQSGKVLTQYLYVDGRPVAMMKADGAQTRLLYAVHADQRGLPLAVTDGVRRALHHAVADGRAVRRPGNGTVLQRAPLLRGAGRGMERAKQSATLLRHCCRRERFLCYATAWGY